MANGRLRRAKASNSMNQTRKNMLTRALTGTVFVVVVMALMLAGRWSYAALLAWVGVWCVIEFWRLSRGAMRWLGMAYIAVSLAALWFLPSIGAGMGGAEGWDVRIAPAFMIVVWANDVFAYLIGVALGRHKMAPVMSPNKSWEGFAGGVLGATVVAALLGRLWIGGGWIWVPFGVVTALASVAGDLAESKLKRCAGVKDSGHLLPGHGGLLDRMDATLGAAPAAFLFLIVTYLTR